MLLGDLDPTANTLRDHSLNGAPTTDSRVFGTAAIIVGITGLFCAVLPVLGYLAACLRYP